MIHMFFVLFAVLGLSFLIFIHELGHYWMARRVGMRVETFSVGFGRPIYRWQRNGVNWQIGWLLLGGYVKIAGTETDGKVDPYSVSDGFFGKKPWDRIKVAFMGPFVNVLFAFVLFAVLWGIGGREKSFSEFSSKIGWVDPSSELYEKGVRPGDEIFSYNKIPFHSYKDHFYGPMIAGEKVVVDGAKIDYKTGERFPFEYEVDTYSHPMDQRLKTAGILASARYMIYDRLPEGKENPLPEGSPLQGSGIQYGDRILWVDGKPIYSLVQLGEILNDGKVLLTIQREGKSKLRRVPRVLAKELRPDAEFREEMIDWQHEAEIVSPSFQNLYVIPYNLSYDVVVENGLRFVDPDHQARTFPSVLFSEIEEPLQPGDRIIAVQGKPISRSYELIRELQKKQVQIIVKRRSSSLSDKLPLSYKEAEAAFNQDVRWEDLDKIVASIGTMKPISYIGDLYLLNPVTPKARLDFPMSEAAKEWLSAQSQTKEDETGNKGKGAHPNALMARNHELLLGMPSPHDMKVTYNPKPTEQFYLVAEEIGRLLEGLFSRTVSIKNVAGPVGIVHMVQSSSMVSWREALFWIGAISLNLGMLNLLPIPILDGGTIVFSFFEMLTGRRIHPKTMEKMIVVFAVLLVSFFLFVTYNDVVNLFGKFWG